MTVDSLLAILLAVVIPFALAVAGGILAIKALPPEAQVRRNWWISLFVALTLIGIVLAFAQQVLLTKEQKEADEKGNAREVRMISDTKFTQGQLDSINKVLTAVISKSGDSGLVKEVLKALAGQAAQAGNSGQQSYSNSQLRDAALDLARRLREFQLRFSVASQDLLESYRKKAMAAVQNKDKEESSRLFNEHRAAIDALDNSEKADFVPLRAESLNMRSQLLNRLPPQPEDRIVKGVLDDEFLGGAEPLYKVSSYFERLARLLPDK